MSQPLVSPNDIRSRFAQAMSDMYRLEVPLYADLMELVAQVNANTLATDTTLAAQLAHNDELSRLAQERHGAIRVGTAAELSMLRRAFAVIGMLPVGYYDLSVAGVPVHSTAFRPTTADALAKNPFRVFTSLLRLELVEDPALRVQAEAILAKRDIFTAGTRELIAKHEQDGGLYEEDAQSFVDNLLETFRWHGDATVSRDTYLALHQSHRLIADVVCFRGPHINHLTPRTLDINAAQADMQRRGIDAKAVIEGPPHRTVPLLLRQTSFKALEEPIAFPSDHGSEAGTHTARFGEIEQRGLALTPKGRALYDQLLKQAREDDNAGSTGKNYSARLSDVFAAFPDDHDTLRREDLGYYRYTLTETGATMSRGDRMALSPEAMIAAGLAIADPIVYEDFLPVSAAGIFQSNLGGTEQRAYEAHDSKTEFEHALGAQVQDEFALYARFRDDSIEVIHKA